MIKHAEKILLSNIGLSKHIVFCYDYDINHYHFPVYQIIRSPEGRRMLLDIKNGLSHHIDEDLDSKLVYILGFSELYGWEIGGTHVSFKY